MTSEMKIRAIRTSVLMGLLLSANGLFDSAAAAINPAGPPKGITIADWAAIQAEYQRHRYTAVPEEGGFRARNFAQQWLARFDGRGFTIYPDSARWTWGIALERYGFAGREHAVGQARAASDAGRIRYEWGALEEWYVNDARGLEHGYTLRRRPEGAGGTLRMYLRVRGPLRPEVMPDARGVSFVDASGQAMVTYAGLKVWDADSKVLAARFEAATDSSLRLAVEEAGARYPLTIDPVAQQAYLKASNTGAGDFFGYSVAVSGDTAVVGAPEEDSNATGVNGDQTNDSGFNWGAAYVFVRSGGTWSQQAYLKASSTGAGDRRFGFSVAVSGETVVVGAPDEDSTATGVNGDGSGNTAQGASSGAAYVFVRSGGTWSQQAYLKASNTGAFDRFGRSVAVSGDTVVVGAPGEQSTATGVNGDQFNNGQTNAGAAYVFVRSGGTWSQQAYLKASNTAHSDIFGESVAVSGDTVVVGAPQEQSTATGVNGDQSNNSGSFLGAAYVFVRSGGTWSQQAYLKASNTGVSRLFGQSVAMSGDTVVVGAPEEQSAATGVNGDQSNNSVFGAGAVYVLVRSGGTWSQQAYLKASNTGLGDRFGRSVAVSGDTVVVGAHDENSNATGVNGDQSNNSAEASGAAYVFARSGGTWSQQAYLKASNTGAEDFFGQSVAVSGDTVLVGALAESSNATGVNGDQSNNSLMNSGAAYLFATLPAPDITPQFIITRFVVTYNRVTGRYREAVTLTNNGPALTAAAYATDFLTSGVAVVSPSGTTQATNPPGSSYIELGALGDGATLNFNIEFTRTGAQAIAYTPRLLGEGQR